MWTNLMLVAATPSLWPNDAPPAEVAYPTSDDQGSLEDLMRRRASQQDAIAAPLKAPAPTAAVPMNEPVVPVEPLSNDGPAILPPPPPEAAAPPPPASGPPEAEAASPAPPTAEQASSPVIPEPTAAAVPASSGRPIPKSYKVYIWQETGDTLWRIAQKVYGDKDKWPLIYAANRNVLKNPNKIYPKQVLKIPPPDWQP